MLVSPACTPQSWRAGVSYTWYTNINHFRLIRGRGLWTKPAPCTCLWRLFLFLFYPLCFNATCKSMACRSRHVIGWWSSTVHNALFILLCYFLSQPTRLAVSSSTHGIGETRGEVWAIFWTASTPLHYSDYSSSKNVESGLIRRLKNGKVRFLKVVISIIIIRDATLWLQRCENLLKKRGRASCSPRQASIRKKSKKKLEGCKVTFEWWFHSFTILSPGLEIHHNQLS